MNKKTLTTKDVMLRSSWPQIKRKIDGTVSFIKKDFPYSFVELMDSKTCWHITVDGEMFAEIDCLDIVNEIN
jgi:hypothetical protein